MKLDATTGTEKFIQGVFQFFRDRRPQDIPQSTNTALFPVTAAIAHLRDQTKITTDTLALRLGVPRHRVAYIENKYPNLDDLNRLAALCREFCLPVLANYFERYRHGLLLPSPGSKQGRPRKGTP